MRYPNVEIVLLVTPCNATHVATAKIAIESNHCFLVFLELVSGSLRMLISQLLLVRVG